MASIERYQLELDIVQLVCLTWYFRLDRYFLIVLLCSAGLVFQTTYFSAEAFATSSSTPTSNMVADMSYSTVSSVIDSWEEIRRIDDYEKKVGVALFTK